MINKKILFGATLWLVAGYAIGQGSAFLLQLVLRHEVDPEIAGTAFFYLSIFSLCFQFSDLGNATYSNKFLVDKNEIGYRGFIVGRALFSIPITALSVFLFNISNSGLNIVAGAFFALPLASFLFGASEVSRVEVGGRYKTFALLQAAPWVLTSVLIWLTFGMDLIYVDYLPYIWLMVPVIYLLIAKSNIFIIIKSFKNIGSVEFFAPLAFLLPPLIAQVWGRYMLILVLHVLSVSSLGPLGIVRSVHTAGCVLFGFLIRPMILKFVLETSSSKSEIKKLFSPGKMLLLPLFLGIGIAIALVIFPTGIPKDIAYWLPILIGVPIWGFTSILTFKNQLELKPKVFFWVDFFGVLAHIAGFFSLLSFHPAWAFVSADLARLILIFLIKNKFLNKQ